MAITKNRILTRDNTLSLSAELGEYWDDCDFYDYYCYDSYYYGYYDCDCIDCKPLGHGEYDYINTSTDYRTILSKVRGVWMKSNPTLNDRLINLDTVYSKEIMRDRKIERILGLTFENPTMGDIFYEEFRNIQKQLDSRGCSKQS